jgi:hypothetical protein
MTKRTTTILAAGTLAFVTLSSCRQRDGQDAPTTAAARAPRRPNIIFLTVDTLRADHMALYDYELPFTPTVYDTPIDDLRGVFGLHRDTKAVRKPMTREQVQRLRALGYLQ